MLVVSACLAGVTCRFDGTARPDRSVEELVKNGRAILVCPEQLGGLPTPRPPAERNPATGRVCTADGTDVTEEYLTGARRAADRAVDAGATGAILKSKSPACGCSRIYDGTHSGTLIPGRGVFAEELAARGIPLREV